MRDGLTVDRSLSVGLWRSFIVPTLRLDRHESSVFILRDLHHRPIISLQRSPVEHQTEMKRKDNLCSTVKTSDNKGYDRISLAKHNLSLCECLAWKRDVILKVLLNGPIARESFVSYDRPRVTFRLKESRT